MSETTEGRVHDSQGAGFDLEGLAKLCSVGAVPIPNDLPEEQQAKLLVAIGQRRRKRLIHLFASAIADDIWRERQV